MPTHAEKKTLRQTPEQIFQIVADVHRYPEFLPWCVGARILTRDEGKLTADLTIGFYRPFAIASEYAAKVG